MRTKALWREVKEMVSCEPLPGGDAEKRCLVEMLLSTAQWRCSESLPSGDAAKRCLVEMLRSAALWRCCGALLALLDEGTVA